MRKLGLIVLCLAIFGLYGCAKGSQEVEAGEGNPCEHNWKKYVYNECSPHTVDTDTDTHADRDDPLGVGADVLIHETEHLDLVAEYKYDFENEEHSVFAVFKTKKSLVDYIKALYNKNFGE